MGDPLEPVVPLIFEGLEDGVDGDTTKADEDRHDRLDGRPTLEEHQNTTQGNTAEHLEHLKPARGWSWCVWCFSGVVSVFVSLN